MKKSIDMTPICDKCGGHFKSMFLLEVQKNEG